MGGRRAGIVAAAFACALATAAPAYAGSPSPPSVSLGTAGVFEYMKSSLEGVTTQSGPPADCPAGQEVVGGGGTISGSGLQASLNATAPTNFGGEGWLAEGTSTGTGRKVTTFAICTAGDFGWNTGTSPMQPAGDPGGLDSLYMSDGCSSPERAIAGVAGDGGNVRLVATRPVGASNWEVQFRNFGATGADGTLTYRCTSDFDTANRNEAARVRSGESKTVKAKCRSGEAVINGGFASTLSPVAFAEATWATSTRPFDSGDDGKVPEDGWQVKLQNDGEEASRLNVHALCAS